MTEGLKDLLFREEKPIKGEKQYKLINWLTEDEIKRIAWCLEYEELTVIIGTREEIKKI